MPKQKECPQCHNLHTRRGITCSNQCAAALRKQTFTKSLKVCALCGDEFPATAGSNKYCPKAHYKKCEVCGDSFEIAKRRESKKNPTCSPHCGAILSHRGENNKEKRRKNSLEKWGVEHPFQADDVKAQIEKKIAGTAGRFGTEAYKKALFAKYGVVNASQIDFVKEKKADTFNKNYTEKGIFPPHGPVSKTNLRWKQKLEEATGLTWQLEKFFKGVGRIDLYAENNGRKIAVEINPTATHNIYKNSVVCYSKNCALPCNKHTLDKNYHFDKSKNLKELHGISLTSVFDWMDEDKIISFIRAYLHCNENKIYAKQTKIISISQRDANAFLKENHLLGGSRKQTYCYALTYKGEIVQVQTFSPLGKEDGVFEAKRMATKRNWSVIGGISKGTKHFVKEVKPKKIVAFADLNLSWPDYDISFNGFTRVAINKPQKCWSKGSRMVLDKSAARQSADRLLGIANDSTTSKYPEDWSNEDVFLAEGWLPVWDCGMIKDVWVNFENGNH